MCRILLIIRKIQFGSDVAIDNPNAKITIGDAYFDWTESKSISGGFKEFTGEVKLQNKITLKMYLQFLILIYLIYLKINLQ